MRRLLILLLLIPSCLDAKPLSDKLAQDLTGVGKSAPSATEPKDFYSDKKRGWFWYEDPPPKEEDEVLEEPLATAAPSGPGQTAAEFTYQELWTMYPPKFQEVYDNTLHQAMMTNAVEDVRDLALMHDVARRRGVALAEVFSYVTSTTPQFNTVKDFPMATPGRRALLSSRFNALDSEMQNVQNQYALLYFHSPGCAYCTEQEKILQLFNRKHGWEIEPIDIEQNPGLANQFDITTTPTLFLIQKDNPDPFPVAYGVTPVDELEKNIYQGIRILNEGPVGSSTYDFHAGSSMDSRAIRDKKDIKTYGGVPSW